MAERFVERGWRKARRALERLTPRKRTRTFGSEPRWQSVDTITRVRVFPSRKRHARTS